jgi:uncharacterized protein YacL
LEDLGFVPHALCLGYVWLCDLFAPSALFFFSITLLRRDLAVFLFVVLAQMFSLVISTHADRRIRQTEKRAKRSKKVEQKKTKKETRLEPGFEPGTSRN